VQFQPSITKVKGVIFGVLIVFGRFTTLARVYCEEGRTSYVLGFIFMNAIALELDLFLMRKVGWVFSLLGFPR